MTPALIDPARAALLLAWADRHHPTAAARTRALASRPLGRVNCLRRLDELWWKWAIHITAAWPKEVRRRRIWDPIDRAVALGAPRLEAERQVLLVALAEAGL
jgi:hypothetical protein